MMEFLNTALDGLAVIGAFFIAALIAWALICGDETEE